MTTVQTAMEAARRAMRVEAAAILRCADTVMPELARAVELIRSRPGRVVVSGLGKSGLIGAKLAATLASTGTPAYFMHAADALHGDSGSVTNEDVALLISNSGETLEVCHLAGMLREWGVPIIAMAGVGHSTLVRTAGIWLDIAVEAEADPLGLAPTSSTATTLAIGDALASALMVMSGFNAEEFGRRHPGGALGARLIPEVAP